MCLCASEQRLSSDCEDQIRVILQESALDYRLDLQLQIHCTQEVWFYRKGFNLLHRLELGLKTLSQWRIPFLYIEVNVIQIEDQYSTVSGVYIMPECLC